MIIEAKQEPGIFDADGERNRVGELVDLIVGVRICLRRTAREEPEPDAIDAVILENLEAVLSHTAVLVQNTARFEKGEVREVSARNEGAIATRQNRRQRDSSGHQRGEFQNWISTHNKSGQQHNHAPEKPCGTRNHHIIPPVNRVWLASQM
jgi:hypothetical protein